MRNLIDACCFLDDGFAAFDNECLWRLGAICIIRTSDGKHVVVQKAVKADKVGYEFSGLWSFPGGMVRRGCASKSEPEGSRLTFSSVVNSLVERVGAETGISRDQLKDIRPCDEVGCLVTSYTAKGAKRYTVVLPFVAELSESAKIVAADRSITQACSVQLSEQLPSMSPANSIFAMRELCVGEDVVVKTLAWQKCQAWAGEIEFNFDEWAHF